MADEQWSFFYFYDPEQPAGCFRIERRVEASPRSHKKSLKTPLERLQARSTGQVNCDHGDGRNGWDMQSVTMDTAFAALNDESDPDASPE
ncbi:hypothetical protein NDU88_000829 [Pleurodeles waltl]|uniref:Uncharacterized protein n=1 Tax=Pleurodeles waltl TaxID=8319 RepID=A0AAV7LB91_PLEWA|nr:hypothetical protein NDU88_000829 [Pleurodeles waltl]